MILFSFLQIDFLMGLLNVYWRPQVTFLVIKVKIPKVENFLLHFFHVHFILNLIKVQPKYSAFKQKFRRKKMYKNG